MAHPDRKGGTLALDHGDKRTGFAYADALGITTTPLEPFLGAGDAPELVDCVAELCRERDVGRVLIGLPLRADGSESPRCRVVRAFAERLGRRLPELELAWVDEHLSSKAAEELLREAGLGGRAGRALRDSWSALVLLRAWLEDRRRSPGV